MAKIPITWQQNLRTRYEAWYALAYPSGFKDGFMTALKPHSDQSTADLTDAIKAWVKYSGGKIDNNSGLSSFRIEKIERRGGIEKRPKFNKMAKGRSDLTCAHVGNNIAIEIKCAATNDSSSPQQYNYYLDITTPNKITGKAPGLYIIAETMQGFVDWWMDYEESLKFGMFPLKVDGTPLQPVYDKPKEKKMDNKPLFSNDIDGLPTLDEWRKGQKEECSILSTPKVGKPKEVDKVLSAYIAAAPPYVRDGANSTPLKEIDAYYHYFLAQGFKIALKPCIYYKLKPLPKIQKRVPKGYRLKEWTLIDEQGFAAIEWKVLEDGTYQHLNNTENISEKFCIPDMIISKGDEVFVIDCKKDCNDFKLWQYAAKVRFIMEAKGDKRVVKTATVNHSAGGRHHNFNIPIK